MTVPASAGHPDLARFVAEGAAAGRWPGGVYAVGAPGDAPRFLGAEGALALEPRREEARADALYDLASLSKPLALAIVLLRLADRGVVDLDRPLDDLLPEMRGYAGRTPSFADLLTHSSGLPAWAPRQYYSLVYDGWLSVPRTGVYRFSLRSDDGSVLRLDGQELIDNDGLGGKGLQHVETGLAAGLHAIEVQYFQHRGDVELRLWWEGPGLEAQPIAASALWRSGEAE